MRLAALATAGALILAACGNDSDDGDAATEPPEEEEAAGDEAGSEEEGELRVWLNGTDTSEEQRQFAIDQFNELHPNVEVVVEEQEWEGLVERLNAVLPTSDSPDIVETGTTQTPGFAEAGALVDLTEFRDRLGGDDLLPALVESGTSGDSLFGMPLLAGARVVTYRTDLFEASGLEVPTTMEEFIEAGRTLQEDNADVPNFSGIYLPGRNWHAQMALLWDAGGDIAVEEDGEWVGQLTSPQSIEAYTTIQDIMQNINSAPADGDDANDFEEFCAGEIGMLLGSPGWKQAQILDTCPEEMEGKVGAFALPATGGGIAPAFIGGSHLGISANSDNVELAVDFLEIIAGEEFQVMYAERGVMPALQSQADSVVGDEGTTAQAEVVPVARSTPADADWVEVEGQEILHDLGTAIGQGNDVETELARANDAIEEILNQ